MLLSKVAIDPASELLEGRDFYRPAHEAVFETSCCRRYARRRTPPCQRGDTWS